MIKNLICLCLMLYVYGTDWCPACHLQQVVLTDMNIPFIFIDIDKNPLPGIDSIPVLYNTDTHERHVGMLTGQELKDFIGVK